MILFDDSNCSIKFSVWGENAEREYVVGEVIFVKGEVDEFQGKNLGLGFSGHVDVTPDSEEAVRLNEWYTNEFPNGAEQALIQCRKIGSAEIGNTAG